MPFENFEDAGLQCSRQTGYGGIILGTCDVTVTSFYIGLKSNFNTTSTIYAGIRRYAKFRAYSPSRCEDITNKKIKTRGKNMPPAAGGWRGGTAADGLRSRDLTV